MAKDIKFKQQNNFLDLYDSVVAGAVLPISLVAALHEKILAANPPLADYPLVKNEPGLSPLVAAAIDTPEPKKPKRKRVYLF